MTKPRALDLFCGAGGVSEGLRRAGFEVVGVDIAPQPRYRGGTFIQADALTFPLEGFDLAHASPPCQDFCAYGRRPEHVRERGNLIPVMRERFRAWGGPFTLENVEGARGELRDPILLCGSMFGLDVQRHRLFECSFPVLAPVCNHVLSQWAPRFPGASNRGPSSRRTVEVGVYRIPLATQRKAMGIDWMELHELTLAIPPAYGEWLGRQALRAIAAARRAA